VATLAAVRRVLATSFSKRFFEDVHDVWEEGGLEILRAAAAKNPLAFVALMGSLVPRDFGVEPPKRGVGFEAIWAAMGSGTVPNVESPADIEDTETVGDADVNGVAG